MLTSTRHSPSWAQRDFVIFAQCARCSRSLEGCVCFVITSVHCSVLVRVWWWPRTALSARTERAPEPVPVQPSGDGQAGSAVSGNLQNRSTEGENDCCPEMQPRAATCLVCCKFALPRPFPRRPAGRGGGAISGEESRVPSRESVCGSWKEEELILAERRGEGGGRECRGACSEGVEVSWHSGCSV
jgi:hypothetical protein